MKEIEKFIEDLSLRLEHPELFKTTYQWWNTTNTGKENDIKFGIEELRKAMEKIREKGHRPPWGFEI